MRRATLVGAAAVGTALMFSRGMLFSSAGSSGVSSGAAAVGAVGPGPVPPVATSEYWKARYQAGQTGWQRRSVHEVLERHHRKLTDGLPNAASPRIMVPLSGSTNDIAFLAEKGFPTVGLEFVDTAIAKMYTGDTQAPMIDTGLKLGKFKVWAPAHTSDHLNHISVLQGDLFDATPQSLGKFGASWDVASLIAIDPKDRPKYAATILGLLEADARILLVTTHYDQSKTQGPPFSTSETDVRTLFGSHFNIQVVESTPTTIRGEVPATQDVYLLTRKPTH